MSDMSRVRLDDELNIDALPPGEISRLRIEIGHNALGAAMRLPVLVARGRKPGPVFGVTAAVHGDEINGIPVIHRLFNKLNPQNMRGALVAVLVVNLPGFHEHERQFSDRRDLNHLMPGRSDGNEAQLYAWRFMHRVARHFDFLVDMHTASFGRINSLYVRADMTHEATARIAYQLEPEIIVHNPAHDGTLRGAVRALGIPSVTLEIGNPLRFQQRYIERSLAGLRAVLSDCGVTPRRKPLKPKETVLCASSKWLYTDHGGLLTVLPGVTDFVRAGEVVGTLSNIFGDAIATYSAQSDGVVIGKSVNPVGRSGARILHLGEVVSQEHPFFRRETESVGAANNPGGQ